MKCGSIFATSVSIFLASTAATLANGALAGFPAGGVVFKQAKNISIAREDLDIGFDRIHVHYVFMSSARKPVQTTIGFPMAKVQLNDSPDGIANTSRAENRNDVRNYMAFKVSVNGKPLTPKLHEYAWSGDTNITRKLRAMDVPVFAATADTYKKLAQLPEAAVRKLEREKLAVKEENGAWLVPQWLYQSVYEWRQTFAPGKTEVDISYKPLYGASNDYQYYYEGGKGAPLYCLDQDIKKKLAELKAKGKSPEPLTVGYILETAKNWHGPIGEFHLKISEKNSFSSFCVPDGLKAAGDGSWEAKDFVPGTDLKIVFYLNSER
jgi:hypothetical protein